MLKIIACLSLVLLSYSLAAQTIDKAALHPGQVSIGFTSEKRVNLYANKARRKDILDELSNYIKIELFTHGSLDSPVTIEIHQQSLDRVFKEILGEHNYILRYQIRRLEDNRQLNASILQAYSTPRGIDSSRDYRDAQADPPSEAASEQNRDIEALEDIGDFKNPFSNIQPAKLLRFDSTRQRITLADSMGDIGTADAVGLLKHLIKDRSPEVREAAIYSLGDIGSKAAAGVLALAAHDANPQFRDLAISELSLISSDHAVVNLIALIDRQDMHQTIRVLRAVAEIDTPAAREFLWDMSRDENPKISITAYQLLSDPKGFSEF